MSLINPPGVTHTTEVGGLRVTMHVQDGVSSGEVEVINDPSWGCGLSYLIQERAVYNQRPFCEQAERNIPRRIIDQIEDWALEHGW